MQIYSSHYQCFNLTPFIHLSNQIINHNIAIPITKQQKKGFFIYINTHNSNVVFIHVRQHSMTSPNLQHISKSV